MALSSKQLTQLLVDAGFKPTSPDLRTMVAIAYAESGGNPTAHNNKPPDDSYGLWQINMLGSLGPARRSAFGITANSQLFDPATNAKAAYYIYKKQGLSAWTTYTRGTYLKFMDGTTGFEDGKDTESSQPLSDVASNFSGITGAINKIGNDLFNGVTNIAGVVVAVVLLILGVVLLMRSQIANALPSGKAVKIAKGLTK